MPYSNEYEQVISEENEISQTMVDVDLIEVAGDVGAFRAGITLAENLPNNDKSILLKIYEKRPNVKFEIEKVEKAPYLKLKFKCTC